MTAHLCDTLNERILRQLSSRVQRGKVLATVHKGPAKQAPHAT
jgi:hypothetical protein